MSREHHHPGTQSPPRRWLRASLAISRLQTPSLLDERATYYGADMQVAVIGAGSWGTTVAHLCAHNAPTMLFSRNEETAESINGDHVNERYLAGYGLHHDLRATADLEEVADGADLFVMGVPVHAFRTSLRSLAPHVGSSAPIVSLSKGLERGTGKRMTQLIAEEIPSSPFAALTGPNLAKEILSGHAAASVIATPDPAVGDMLQDVFATNLFRVYTNDDVVGCELGGALKNVIAIAAGMAVGLGTGDNTLAAVITRGLAELSRLGVAMGGDPRTFSGLAGMGDLLATCMSPQSRNRTVGELIGHGKPLDECVAEVGQIVEGVKSAPVATALGEELGVELPICEQVRAVVEEGRTAAEAYAGLLRRPSQSEYRSD